jgi:hypothetical protein
MMRQVSFVSFIRGGPQTRARFMANDLQPMHKTVLPIGRRVCSCAPSPSEGTEMKKSRFRAEQIITVLKEHQAGSAIGKMR